MVGGFATQLFPIVGGFEALLFSIRLDKLLWVLTPSNHHCGVGLFTSPTVSAKYSYLENQVWSCFSYLVKEESLVFLSKKYG